MVISVSDRCAVTQPEQVPAVSVRGFCYRTINAIQDVLATERVVLELPSEICIPIGIVFEDES